VVLISAIGGEETLQQVVARDIVIAGYAEGRRFKQIHISPGSAKFFGLCALGKIAAYDNKFGTPRVQLNEQNFCDLFVESSEMQVRDMRDTTHAVTVRLSRSPCRGATTRSALGTHRTCKGSFIRNSSPSIRTLRLLRRPVLMIARRVRTSLMCGLSLQFPVRSEVKPSSSFSRLW